MSAVSDLRHERVPHPGLSLWEIVSLVAALMALNAVATSMMLPALPAMSEALSVADNDRQLVITAYMIGLACASLFFGPLSDTIGRRTTLLIGLSLYIIGGVYSTFAMSYEHMLAARALQGVGAAAPRVASISMIRDWYSGRQMGKVMSLVMVAFQIAPVIAPFLGQVVLWFAPWQGVFAALTMFGVLLLVWCLMRLPESLDPVNQRPLEARSILSAYRLALTTRVTVGYMMAMTFVFACLFAFINSAQQVFMERFALADLFPIVFAAISIAMGPLLLPQLSDGGEVWPEKNVSHGSAGLHSHLSVDRSNCLQWYADHRVVHRHPVTGDVLLRLHWPELQHHGHGTTGTRCRRWLCHDRLHHHPDRRVARCRHW